VLERHQKIHTYEKRVWGRLKALNATDQVQGYIQLLKKRCLMKIMRIRSKFLHI
jgi:hypothetical protein